MSLYAPYRTHILERESRLYRSKIEGNTSSHPEALGLWSGLQTKRNESPGRRLRYSRVHMPRGDGESV